MIRTATTHYFAQLIHNSPEHRLPDSIDTELLRQMCLLFKQILGAIHWIEQKDTPIKIQYYLAVTFLAHDSRRWKIGLDMLHTKLLIGFIDIGD